MMQPTTYVYIIGREEGPVKVGITSSLFSRLSSVQTGCPFKAELLYAMPCDDRDHARRHEATFHFVHAEHRTAGEWFDMAAEDAIGELFTQFDFEAWEDHTARLRRRA